MNIHRTLANLHQPEPRAVGECGTSKRLERQEVERLLEAAHTVEELASRPHLIDGLEQEHRRERAEERSEQQRGAEGRLQTHERSERVSRIEVGGDSTPTFCRISAPALAGRHRNPQRARMNLTDQQRALTRLFTAAVLGAWEEVRAIRRSASCGEPDRAWREAVLQVHLFAGFPRLVETLGILAEEGGLGDPMPEEVEGDRPDPLRGERLFERIYGDGSERVRAMLASGHPDFAAWVAEHAYARVLARPGLSAARRELLACCALAALAQDRQLASHARGAVRCGATHAELVESLELVADLIGRERLERALHITARFAAE